MNKEEFIKKAKIVHNDKYDYSKIKEQFKSKDKICIICPIHGEFFQRASEHISGAGCKKCANEKLSNRKKKTTEQFIEEARKIHGDKYDYSKVEYIDSATSICIICPEHGEFWQIPNNHLRGRGCPKCGELTRISKKISNSEEFIQKAKKVHGDKYDYSKVEYVDNVTNVCIICPEHGEFFQRPNNHLNGCGCPECGKIKISTKNTFDKNTFIQKAKKVHGDKYDYSKVEYINSNTKVCIICPEHGEFWQNPASHLRGNGCPKCGFKLISINNSLSQEEFIQKAKKVHGDKYDYSKVEYINNSTNVCIICPEHGEFFQRPSNHLNGCGCPKCAKIIQNSTPSKTTEQFIEEARKVHGDKYDYSKVEYINSNTKVCIICPTHGEFWQNPLVHLKGSGCPRCSILLTASKKSKTTEQFIEEARKVHGDKYDYSKVEYINGTTEVCIICPTHGEFWQKPTVHLQSGCPKCVNDSKKISFSEFVEKAIRVHGKKYTYDETTYNGLKEQIRIICPKHGEFWQNAAAHIYGSGCQKCKESHMEREIRLFLEKHNINYKYNFKDKWLKNENGYSLSIDFYLEDYNIGIECQGLQHFISVDSYGGDKEISIRLNNDIQKYNICKSKGIKMFYCCNVIDQIPNSFIRYYTIYNMKEIKKELLEYLKNVKISV